MDFSMCSYFCMKMEHCNAFRITDENICITYNLTDTNIASCLKISNDFVELWMKKSQLIETECSFVIAKAWRKFLLPTFRDEGIVYSDSRKNKRIDETKEA